MNKSLWFPLLLFILGAPMVVNGVLKGFLSSGFWFLLFSLILLWIVRDKISFASIADALIIDGLFIAVVFGILEPIDFGYSSIKSLDNFYRLIIIIGVCISLIGLILRLVFRGKTNGNRTK